MSDIIIVWKGNLREINRREIQRKIDLANKRIERLKKQEYNESIPALKNIEGKFSIKGKSGNELAKEIARVNQFLTNKTSTVKGTQDYLKNMAKNLEISYKNMNEISRKAKMIFELSDKLSQYLNNLNGSFFHYQQILKIASQYVESNELKSLGKDLDDIVQEISENLNKNNNVEAEVISGSNFVKL